MVDGNYQNRGELLLRHSHEGADLRQDYCRDVLANLYAMWTRPVAIQTKLDDRKVIVRFDGSEYGETESEA